MADTATYDLIASQTLASAASSITFSSIAASWTDLRIILTGSSNGGYDCHLIQFNGDTATNYSMTTMRGYGTGVFTGTSTTQSSISGSSYLPGTNLGVGIMDIFSYTGSTYKTCLINGNGDDNGSGQVSTTVGLWRSTASITSITLTLSSASTYKIGTTANLYGIKAA